MAHAFALLDPFGGRGGGARPDAAAGAYNAYSGEAWKTATSGKQRAQFTAYDTDGNAHLRTVDSSTTGLSSDTPLSMRTGKKSSNYEYQPDAAQKTNNSEWSKFVSLPFHLLINPAFHSPVPRLLNLVLVVLCGS
jgi:hypothetical protein